MTDLYHTLFQAAPEALILTQAGRVTEANAVALNLFGYDQSTLVGQTLLAISPDQQPDGRDSATAWPITDDLTDQPLRFEWCFQDATGQLFETEVRCHQVETASETVLCFAMQDVAARKQAEKSLRDSEQRLADLIDFLPDATFAVDLDGRLIAWNKAMEKLSGINAETVLGKGDYEYALPFYGERRPILVDLIVTGNEQIAENYPFIEQDGHNITTELFAPYINPPQGAYIWAKASPLYDAHGQIVGAIEAVRDITQRKQAEQVRQEREARLQKYNQLLGQLANSRAIDSDETLSTLVDMFHHVTTAPDLERLFQQLVELLQSRFDYTYVQIGLVLNDRLVIQQGSGALGQQLQGQEIALTEDHNLMTLAVRQGQSILRPEMAAEPNGLVGLPAAKSVLAVPIKLGDNVLGVLNVQNDDQARQLNEDDEMLLVGLSGQLAVAIEGSYLLAETKIFRQFAETASQGLAMADPSGKLVYLNPAAAHILGLAQPADGYQYSLEFFHPFAFQSHLQKGIIPTVLETGEWSGELFLRRYDGQIFPSFENWFLIRDEKGHPKYLAAVLTDITERKQSEADMSARLQELNSLQRLMSREAWQTYQPSQIAKHGYLFDPEAWSLVQPLSDRESLAQEATDDSRPITTPMTIRGEIIGQLGLYENRDQPLSPEDEALLEAIAIQVAEALENARLLEQTQKRAAERAALNEVSLKIINQSDPHAVYQTAVETLVDKFNMSFARIWTLENASRELVLQVSYGEYTHLDGPHSRVSLDSTRKLARIANNRQPEIFNDLLNSFDLDNPDWARETLTVAFAGYPLFAGSDLLGILGMFSHETIDAETLPLLQSLAVLIGTVVNSQRLFEQADARARQLATVAEVSTKATTILDPEQLLQAVADLTKERFKLYHAHIYLLNEETATLDLMAGAGSVGRQMVAEGWRIPLSREQSLVARAARTQQGLMVNDVQHEADFLPNPLLPDTQSELATPMMVGGRVLGVLDVQADVPRRFTEEDLQINATLATQVAVALQNASLFENMTQAQTEAEERLRETQILQDLSRILAGTLQIREVVEAFFQICMKLFGFDYVLLSLVDKKEQRVKAIEGLNVSEELINQANQPLDSADIMADIIRTGKTEVITGWDDRFDRQTFDSEGHARWGARLFMPLTIRQEHIGLIELGFKHQADMIIDEDHIRLIKTFVNQMALAVENARRYIENRRLFEAAQSRAEQLEKLANIETALSLAVNEEDILAAIALATEEPPRPDIVLYYLDIDRQGQTATIKTIAMWQAGTLSTTDNADIYRRYHLSEFPNFTQWIKTADEVLFIDDLATDDSLDELMRIEFEAQGVCSMVLLPLFIGGHWQGIVTFNWLERRAFSRDERFIFEKLLEPVGAVVASHRAQQAQQAALEQMQLLYELGVKLNAATTLGEILEIVTTPAIESGAISAQLYRTELAAFEDPRWAECVATWQRQGQPAIPSGSRHYLPDLPFGDLLLADRENPQLISDLTTASFLDLPSGLKSTTGGPAALALLPLTLAGQWVGFGVIQWPQPHQFTDRETRLYKTLMVQAAVAVNNRLLLEEAQERATQLETVAQLEIALSQATNEAEIVLAVAYALADEAVRISLQYLDTDVQDKPLIIRPVAVWSDGALDVPDPLIDVGFPVPCFTSPQLWPDKPTDLLLMPAIPTDPRTSDTIRQWAEQSHFQALTLIPLRSGGRWQGILLLTWPMPREFSEREKFIYQRLLESLAPVVASRRAYLAQQKALMQTESLYEASRRINEAADLQSIIAAVAEAGPVEVINRVVLVMYELDDQGEMVAITVAANWYNGQGKLPTPVGTHYPRQVLDADYLLLTDEPLFFNNVLQDPNITPEAVELYRNLHIQAMAVLPLWAGDYQRGAILLESELPHYFTETEIQPYVALSRQVAVALENQRLLQETQSALAEVEAIQRRYTLQAWESYRNRQRQLRFEQSREDVPLPAETTLNQLSPVNQPANGAASLDIGETDESDDPSLNILQGTVVNQTAPPAELVETTNAKTVSNLVVPLKVRDETIGLLGLQELADNHEWAEEEIAFVEAVAEQVAQAAENLRLLDETQQRAAREARVNDIGEKIRAAQTFEEALKVAIQEIGLTLQAPQTMAQLDAQGLGFGYDLTTFTPLDDPRLAEVSASEALQLPLMVQNLPIGQLIVQNSPGQNWSQDEILLVEAVADQLAQKTENLRLFEETQQQATREQITRQIADKIRASRDVETALKTAAQELTQALGVARTVIKLRTNDEG